MFFSSSILCLFAALIVGNTALKISFKLSIRDYDKICSEWVYTGNDEFTYGYYVNSECISAMSLEQRNGEARLCCQCIPFTTPSTNFPKECGKQQYQPLGQRIVGGVQAAAHSWVCYEIYDIEIELVFLLV